MRLLFTLTVAVGLVASCGQSSGPAPVVAPTPAPQVETTEPVALDENGGYDFDRSDPEGGVANIMAAFATDEATATCIFDAWGDVSKVPAVELTTDLMNFPICGTSIFQMMTGDGRFTGRAGDE